MGHFQCSWGQAFSIANKSLQEWQIGHAWCSRCTLDNSVRNRSVGQDWTKKRTIFQQAFSGELVRHRDVVLARTLATPPGLILFDYLVLNDGQTAWLGFRKMLWLCLAGVYAENHLSPERVRVGFCSICRPYNVICMVLSGLWGILLNEHNWTQTLGSFSRDGLQ